MKTKLKESEKEMAQLKATLENITSKLLKMDNPDEEDVSILQKGDRVFPGPEGSNKLWTVLHNDAVTAADKEDICWFATQVFNSEEFVPYSSYTNFPKEMQKVVNYISLVTY